MSAPRPFTLIAELTHRCPLACAYCSNPTELAPAAAELATAGWVRALEQAEGLGVVALHLTGGEPLLRRDLTELVAAGRRLGLYVSLITSGVPLGAERLAELAAAGLDHVQLSVQDLDAAVAERISGTRTLERKVAVAGWVKASQLALTVNVVLHRHNIDRTAELIDWAERLGADRLELASTQMHGWALVNRAALLPAREQVDRSAAVAHAAKQRLRGRMEVVFVLPDYFSRWPRACMDGWGQRFIVITPSGIAQPCHAAGTIPGLELWSVRDHSLAEIWADSPGFRRFRGDAWMAAPCRTCERRDLDFGGCRCQALALVGDAAATDPACTLSPHHGAIVEAGALARREPQPAPLVLRRGPRAAAAPDR